MKFDFDCGHLRTLVRRILFSKDIFEVMMALRFHFWTTRLCVMSPQGTSFILITTLHSGISTKLEQSS